MRVNYRGTEIGGGLCLLYTRLQVHPSLRCARKEGNGGKLREAGYWREWHYH